MPKTDTFNLSFRRIILVLAYSRPFQGIPVLHLQLEVTVPLQQPPPPLRPLLRAPPPLLLQDARQLPPVLDVDEGGFGLLQEAQRGAGPGGAAPGGQDVLHHRHGAVGARLVDAVALGVDAHGTEGELTLSQGRLVAPQAVSGLLGQPPETRGGGETKLTSLGEGLVGPCFMSSYRVKLDTHGDNVNVDYDYVLLDRRPGDNHTPEMKYSEVRCLVVITVIYRNLEYMYLNESQF